VVSAAHTPSSNDILRKHGILPQKEALPPSPSPPPSPTLDDLLDDFTPDELQELGEEAHDAENERMIAMYRRQRIADLKTEENKARFGRVYPIGREDYTREVTEASRIDEPGDGKEQGTGVVCFLYKDGYARQPCCMFVISQRPSALPAANELHSISALLPRATLGQSLCLSSVISAFQISQTLGSP
jgi:hypothetical protein